MMKHKLVRIVLIVLEALVALSAIAGGLWLVADRSGLPLAWLAPLSVTTRSPAWCW